MTTQRTEMELEVLDRLELRQRELAAANPFAAAQHYLQHSTLIDEARTYHAAGRPQLPRAPRPGDIPMPSRHHTLRSALLAPIVNPQTKGST